MHANWMRKVKVNIYMVIASVEKRGITEQKMKNRLMKELMKSSCILNGLAYLSILF